MDPQLARIAHDHGVWLRREARDLGYHDPTIQRLVDRGVWERVRWGAYTYGSVWDTLDANERYSVLCRAAYRRAQTEVALSHRSAANEWGAPMWDIDLDEVDLTRRDGRTGRREAGIAQHRGRILDSDWVEHNGISVMAPTRAALELTTMLDIEHSLVEIDHLLHRGLMTKDELEARLALMTHWPDTLKTDLVVRLSDDRAESVAETRARYLCWREHLPRPEVNHPILDLSGRELYRTDLAWPEYGLFVEVDGKVKYERYRREGESIADCVERERRRETHIIELTGWRCVRLIWADLYRPRQTADRIRAQFREVAA